MKIALVVPKSTFLEDPMTRPPLGLFYLAARLESLGNHCDFFDMNVDELPDDNSYSQMWVSYTSPQIADVRRILKETDHWKNTKRIGGGASAWDDPELSKSLGFDLTAGGEADNPENMKILLDAVENPPESKYVSLPVSKTLDWTINPIRRWSNKYKSYLRDRDGINHPTTTFFLSRGCPCACSFCSSGRFGKIWDRFTRYESLDRVESQIKEVVEMGYTGLMFYDDVYQLNKHRTLKMLEIQKKYDTRFRCFMRSDILEKHGGFSYLESMADAGLVEFFIGVESADNKIKENIHKGTTIENDNNAIKWALDLGITPKCSLILGLPGESGESMNKTRDWILKQNPKKVKIQLDKLIPFKGTPIVNNPEQYDLTWETQVDDQYFYRGRQDLITHSFVSTSHLSVAEIDEFYQKMTKEMTELGYYN